MFALNVTTLRNMLKAAVPQLLQRGGGSIVNVGAYGAREGQADMSAYCASKSVVMRLTESLANEVRDQGVNVNAVLPTVIDTPANRAGMPDADPSAWVAPEDLANVICFLGSSAAHAVHGALELQHGCEPDGLWEGEYPGQPSIAEMQEWLQDWQHALKRELGLRELLMRDAGSEEGLNRALDLWDARIMLDAERVRARLEAVKVHVVASMHPRAAFPA